MKITEVTVGMMRSIRHRQYVTSQPEAKLTAHIEEGDNIIAAVEELREDLFVLMDDLCEKEIEDDRKRQEEIRNAKKMGRVP